MEANKIQSLLSTNARIVVVCAWLAIHKYIIRIPSDQVLYCKARRYLSSIEDCGGQKFKASLSVYLKQKSIAYWAISLLLVRAPYILSTYWVWFPEQLSIFVDIINTSWI